MKKILKSAIIIVLSIGALGLTQSCKKEVSIPEVWTLVASEVTQSDAKSGGVVKDGGTEVTARGVCWGTSQNPTTSSDKTTDGRGSGYFSSVMTGLAANTTYYVRAYAINSEGTNYGDQIEFTTPVPTTGVQKSDFTGGNRSDAVSFAIGTKVYLGLGLYSDNSLAEDFWEWDQVTDVWIKKADFKGKARIGAVGFSIGTKGYIGTGYTIDGETNEFWEYDPATNTWSEKASLPVTGGRGNAVGFSIGTKGYIGLGLRYVPAEDGFLNYYRDFWEWDQTTNEWTKKLDFAGNGRVEAVGFSIGNNGYIGTGRGYNDNDLEDFWEWNQSTNKWTRKADFAGDGLELAVGFSIGNKGYIGTGMNDYTYSHYIWEWDQETNIWTKKAILGGTARASAIGVSAGNKGYIGTGVIFDDLGGNVFKKDFWEFDPN